MRGFREMRGLKEFAKERSLSSGTGGGRRTGRTGHIHAMARKDALKEAERRWGEIGEACAIVRHKKHPQRFEVGYRRRGGATTLGTYVSTADIICGRGNSWEEAFADADADVAGEKSPICTAP